MISVGTVIFFQVERFEQFRQVVRICNNVVAIPWLTGSPMAATIMGNSAIAMRGPLPDRARSILSTGETRFYAQCISD